MSKALKSCGAVRVLLVDDFRPLTDLLVRNLRESGLDAYGSYNAAEAFRIGEELKPQAVISDVRLPDMDGWTLCAEIERRFPGCKVLLMSANIYMHVPPQDAPHFRLVQKAMVLDELPQLLRSCTGSKEVGAVEGGGEDLADHRLIG